MLHIHKIYINTQEATFSIIKYHIEIFMLTYMFFLLLLFINDCCKSSYLMLNINTIFLKEGKFNEHT